MIATQPHTFVYGGQPLTGPDGSGATWTVETAPGWFDSPAVRSARIPRATQDGEWDYSPAIEGRVITLQGRVFTTSLLALEQAARRFAAVPRKGSLAGLSPFGDLTADVLLEEAPKFDPVTDTTAVWQLTVVSPDPLLYGPEQFGTTDLQAVAGTGWVWPAVFPVDWGIPEGATPGAVQVANAGTRAYWPRLRVDGPVTNPVVQLVETGDWVRYGGTLTAGQWLDVACDQRRVLLNGQVSRRAQVTSSGDWLAVPVGGGSVTWTADDADPAARLSVWSFTGAWI